MARGHRSLELTEQPGDTEAAIVELWQQLETLVTKIERDSFRRDTNRQFALVVKHCLLDLRAAALARELQQEPEPSNLAWGRFDLYEERLNHQRTMYDRHDERLEELEERCELLEEVGEPDLSKLRGYVTALAGVVFAMFGFMCLYLAARM